MIWQEETGGNNRSNNARSQVEKEARTIAPSSTLLGKRVLFVTKWHLALKKAPGGIPLDTRTPKPHGKQIAHVIFSKSSIGVRRSATHVVLPRIPENAKLHENTIIILKLQKYWFVEIEG